MSKVRVVIPSLCGDVATLAAICGVAKSAGASPVVVANSKKLSHELTSTEIPSWTSGRNEGFGGSIALGAQGAWDWLVILNDDLSFRPDELKSCLSAATLDSFGLASIVYLDNEPARQLPTRMGVMLNISLLSTIFRKLNRAPSRQLQAESSFRPFSAVAIGREAWEKLGGFDDRYPFAYEDADFVRRARRCQIQISAVDTRIDHLHSETGRKFVDLVLPVATWSALEYLTKWYGLRNFNRLLLSFALIMRIPPAALLKNPRKQIRAIHHSLKALIRDEKPSLPRWDLV